MKDCVWSAALTITVDGLQFDISELPIHVRGQIAACIQEGCTEGTIPDYASLDKLA